MKNKPFDEKRFELFSLITGKGRTLKDASLQIGKNRGYFYQYIFNGQPMVLPDEVAIRTAEDLNIDWSILAAHTKNDAAAKQNIDGVTPLYQFLVIDDRLRKGEHIGNITLTGRDAGDIRRYGARLARDYMFLPAGSMLVISPDASLRPLDMVVITEITELDHSSFIASFLSPGLFKNLQDQSLVKEGESSLTEIGKICHIDLP